MLQTVDEICERLVKVLNPERVILFGSRARGETVDPGDADLLIVQETQKRPIDRRIDAERAVADRSIPLDLFVYTPDEVRRPFSIGSPFIEEILAEGRGSTCGRRRSNSFAIAKRNDPRQAYSSITGNPGDAAFTASNARKSAWRH